MSLDEQFEITDAQSIELETKQMQCPYCWESFEWVCDDLDESDEMIEDCPVCCQPIHFKRFRHSELNQESQWQAFSEDDFYE